MSLSILWLARTLPLPLTSGDRIYTGKLVEAIACAGAQVTYFGLNNPDEPMGDLDVLDPAVRWRLVPGGPRSRLFSLFSRLPLVGARFGTIHYRSAIERELAERNYDVVVFDQYALSWALCIVRRCARNRPLFVHLAHDFETDVAAQLVKNYTGGSIRRFLLTRNAAKTRSAEAELARNCELLVALTEQDAAEFVRINPNLDTVVLPPGYSNHKQRTRTIDATGPRRVIVVGSFSWTAKQLNLRRLLEAAGPLFVRNRIELHIVGFVPDALRSRLRSQFPGVTFRGFVPDLNQEFLHARLALVPEVTGGGFKLKTLDYIFGRVPVAAVDCALNGISEELKSQFLIADDLPTLATRIIEMIDQTAQLDTMQNRAFTLAEGLFDWNNDGRKFIRSIEAILSKHSARPRLGREAANCSGHAAILSLTSVGRANDHITDLCTPASRCPDYTKR